MENQTLSLSNPLSVPSELTGVGWKLPTDLTEQQWEEAGEMLAKLDQSKQWWLGDWWNAVNYGTGQEVCDRVGINYQSTADCGMVAKEFDFSRRRENLSFSHHREVCPIEDKETQDRFLDWCWTDTKTGEQRKKPKSRNDLREMVRAYLDEQGWTEEEKERRELVKNGGTIVVNQKTDERLIEWARFSGLLEKIDRHSKWGNPFEIPGDGDRDTVCDSYAIYLNLKFSLTKDINSLHGKVLACWCYPERCHGDELIRRINHEG